MSEFLRNLRDKLDAKIGCGATMGHGEGGCMRGWECSACRSLRDARDSLTRQIEQQEDRIHTPENCSEKINELLWEAVELLKVFPEAKIDSEVCNVLGRMLRHKHELYCIG